MDFLAGAWGQPGVQDYARTLISQQTSSWGAPGDALAPFLQLVAPSSAPAPLARPSLDPGMQTSTGVANVAKKDGQSLSGWVRTALTTKHTRMGAAEYNADGSCWRAARQKP